MRLKRFKVVNNTVNFGLERIKPILGDKVPVGIFATFIIQALCALELTVVKWCVIEILGDTKLRGRGALQLTTL